jgi:predicted secreted Zn-dependent protease
MPLRIQPAGAVPAATGHRLNHKNLRSLAEAISGFPAARASFGQPTWKLPPPRKGRQAEVTLNVRLFLRMPVWTKRGERPKAERDEWDRFYRALRYHEDGHLDLFRREFTKSFERLKRVADDEIQDTLVEEVARIHQLNEQYEHDTDHGRTQQTPFGTTVINVP